MKQIISCLLLSLWEKKVIMPTAAIAEIVPYGAPEPVTDTPSWFLGVFSWRGIHVPLIDME